MVQFDRSRAVNVAFELRDLGMGPEAREPERSSHGLKDVISESGLTRIRSLLDEKVEGVAWVWDGILPVGGFGVVVAPPKTGKTTFTGELALRVSRGEPHLGRGTRRGRVFCCSFEEIRCRVIERFRLLGADDEDLLVMTGLPGKAFMKALKRDVARFRPVLVILDGLFRTVKVQNGSDYSAMLKALEPLLNLARESGACVLATHHSPKAVDSSDGVLGSTAIFGSVDTLIRLRRTRTGERSIETDQRYGENMPATAIVLDKATGRTSLDGVQPVSDVARAKEKLLGALATSPEPIAIGDLIKMAEGKKGDKTTALRLLLEEGEVLKSGKGVRGSPFCYSISLQTLGAERNRIGTPRTEKRLPRKSYTGCADPADGPSAGSPPHPRSARFPWRK